MKHQLTPGSALLLTVMVISVLTTTTLGAIAVRFDQLSSTDKIGNASKAKLAADSGLVALRQKLTTAPTFETEAYDLTDRSGLTVPVQGRFRPNPRHSAYSLESEVVNLPRCLAVAVLSPWVNTGSYLLDQDESSSNPAMIFYYANIINDTPLGAIGDNVNQLNNDTQKKTPVGELTKMGQFYNPYALPGQLETNKSYWTVKLGGPDDQFLYRRDPSNQGSFYKGLDFVYIPYLPRFTDSGLLKIANQPNSGLHRKSADTIRNDFESVIRQNNFKVWLDAAVTNDWLYQYGLGDLFIDNNADDLQSRVTWLQPSLWNDLPEADYPDTGVNYAKGLAGPYKLTDAARSITNGTQWQPQTTPVKAVASNDPGWNAEIIKGNKSFSFLYPSGDLNKTITKNGTLTLNVFGSLEGLRLNQPITVLVTGKSTGKPINLQSRDNSNQGRYLSVKVTKILQQTGGEIAVELTFFNGDYQTPKSTSGVDVRLADIGVISLLAGPQMATKQSVANATLSTNGKTVSLSSSCSYSEVSNIICPAVGDVVSMRKPTNPNDDPIWGRVNAVTFDPLGKTMQSFELDKFRQMPRPLKEIASTVITEGPTEKIAYYGGSIVANEFDGGLNTTSDELWFYTPSTNTWEHIPNTGTAPGARSGASIALVNNKIYLFGGYNYVGVGEIATGKPCADNYYLSSCLGANKPYARVAKKFSTEMYYYDLTSREWIKVGYHTDNTTPAAIPDTTPLELKVVSKFNDRSGKDGWQGRVVVDTTITTQLSMSAGAQTTVQLTTSNAGFSVSDEIYISGVENVPANTSIVAWGRVVGTPSATQLTITAYGNKNTTIGQVAIKSLSITALGRVKGSNKCTWVSAASGCRLDANTHGVGVGDAVVLERYDDGNYAAPNQLAATYSGYVSSIDSGGVAYFNSDENTAGYDYQTGVAAPNPSTRLMPVGRSGGRFGVNGTKLYYWQGDQVNNTVNTRVADIWEFETTTNRWAPIVLQLVRPPLSTDLTFQTVKMPPPATMFISATNNPAIIKDKEITWKDGAGQVHTELVWDDAKEWIVTIHDESYSNWNRERVTEGAFIIIERRSAQASERFTGTVTKIDQTDSSKIFVKHHGSYSGDSGLADNSNNSRINLSYPNNVNVNATLVNNTRAVNSDSIRASGALATELRKIPAGAVVLTYSGGLSGTNGSMFTATIERRVVDTSYTTMSAAGTAYLSTPLVEKQSTNILIDGAISTEKLAVSYQSYRPKGADGAMQWVNNITGTTDPKKWTGRFPTGYTLNGGNRPAPRQNGFIATSPDKKSIYIGGGSFGPYTNIWKLQDAYQASGGSWLLGKGTVQAANDIPNMYASTSEVLSNGDMVVFGGQRKFTNSTPGPKILGRSDDNTNYDGTYAVVDSNGTLDVKAEQFVNTLKDHYKGPAQNSLQLTTAKIGGWTPCRYIGQEGCDNQLMRHLGTLGRYGSSWGASLALINPGDGFKKENGKKSLILSGPAQSLSGTNRRWDQEGYTPYQCDTGRCASVGIGSLDLSEANNTKALMFAGFSRVNGGGSILVTPAGIGRAISSGPAASDSEKSYCARESVNMTNETVDGVPAYGCKSSQTQARRMKWIPDSEDIVFMFNAAKALSATDAYRVVGYYGGVVRGYLAVSVGSELKVQEIAP